MMAKDLSGMTFGSLYVLNLDDERYDADLILRKRGEIDRIRRYYKCQCIKCGKIISVRGENLSSGNTKGCGCDAADRTGRSRHESHLNKYEYIDSIGCWSGVSNNTGNIFLFDDCDYNVIKDYCWYENNGGYMITRLSPRKQMLLHRMIMSDLIVDNSLLVDHINRNRLDCRRMNLRICTPIQNAWNIGVHSNSKSGECGVRWHEKVASGTPTLL